MTEARIEGSIFKGSLVKDESESSISKSEGINYGLQLKEWKNQARQDGKKVDGPLGNP